MLRKSDYQRCVDHGEPNAKALATRSGLFASLSRLDQSRWWSGSQMSELRRPSRSYSNTPVGLNFLIAGYVYAQGKLAFDPNLSIADAKFHSNTGLMAYVRSFDFAGQSAKFDVIMPGSSSMPRVS